MDIKELPEQIDTSTYSKFLNAHFFQKKKKVLRICSLHYFVLLFLCLSKKQIRTDPAFHSPIPVGIFFSFLNLWDSNSNQQYYIGACWLIGDYESNRATLIGFTLYFLACNFVS